MVLVPALSLGFSVIQVCMVAQVYIYGNRSVYIYGSTGVYSNIGVYGSTGVYMLVSTTELRYISDLHRCEKS